MSEAVPRERSAGTMGRRDALIGTALLLTAGAAFALLPRRRVVALPGRNVGPIVPSVVAGWRATTDEALVLPANDERAAAAVYDDEVTRTYTNGADPAIMFVLAYDRDQSGMMMVHRPESCYPGSGFTITSNRSVSIALAPGLTVQGRFLSTIRGARVEQVLYWTRIGNAFPADWDEERAQLAIQNLRGFAPDGALIRLSTIAIDADLAIVQLREFAALLFAACGRSGRALLAGPAHAARA